MDMNQYNEEIKQAPDEVVNDGPRFPDGRYLMAVVGHEEKNKFPVAGTDPVQYQQVGLWVTFRILHGTYMGKEYKTYYNLRHPTSKACQSFGLSGLKKLYTAVNFMPSDFTGIYAKRFVATLESEEQEGNTDFPWSTKIVKYEKAPPPKGQSMEQAPAIDGANANQTTNPQNNALSNTNLNNPLPAVTPPANEKWQAGQEIDEIPF